MGRYAPAPYTTAQTDAVIVSVPSGMGFRVTHYAFVVDKSCTIPYVAGLFEFDDTADVRFGGHDGVSPGSGWGEGNPGDSSGLAEGGDGQDVTFTCDVPTGGSVSVFVNGDFFPTV